MTREGRGSAAVLAAGLLALGLAACEGEDGGPTTPERGDPASALIDRVEVASSPAANGTYLVGEEVVFSALLTSGQEVETTGEVFLIFDLGLASQPAMLAASEAGRLEFRYEIRRGDYDPDGISVPPGELTVSAGATLRVGGADLDVGVRELPADGEHRVFARYAPGESLVFDATLDRFPVDSLGLSGAVGCASTDDVVPIVEAVLEGNLAGAAGLWSVARQFGRCATLTEGATAIFLSAAILEHRDDIYDLVLAYGPGSTLGREPMTANWWTLGDFLAEPP